MQKRILKKVSFLIILLIIPIIAFSVKYISSLDSGTVKIGIVANGETAKRIAKNIRKSDSLISFADYESEDAASEAVRRGSLTAAWCIDENVDQKIDKIVKGGSAYLVNVIQREDTVLLKMTREVLSSALFPEISQRHYYYYATEKSELADPPDGKEIMERYENSGISVSYVKFVDISGKAASENQDYLSAPLRGILSLAVLISSFAAGMFSQNDETSGKLSMLPMRKRALPLIFSCFAGALDCGVVMFISLILTGSDAGILTEALSLASYILLASAFASFFCAIIYYPSGIGTFLPFICVITLLFAPIFLNLKVGFLKYTVPATLYIYAPSLPKMNLCALAEAAVLTVLSYYVTVYRASRVRELK